MRELKFRQAIFRDSKFHHWHYWGYVGYRDSFVAPITIEQQSSPQTYAVKESQQYIGLRCGPVSLGPRIYEGDIYTYSIQGNKQASPGVIKWKSESPNFPEFNQEDIDPYLRIDLESIRVIGNNHENPDLLKETNGS